MIADNINQRFVLEDFLSRVKFNDEGLVPAIIQATDTKAVLMMAWMNKEALGRTLESGRTWFWSRSRKEYWAKGETSGDVQVVLDVAIDCDGDTILVEVDQKGKGACHTGNYSCFYSGITSESGVSN